MIEKTVDKIESKKDLTIEEAEDVMKEIMSGKVDTQEIVEFLDALNYKGINSREIGAFASTMRDFAETIDPKVDGILVDTCGTGADKLTNDIKTFNISTISAFVVAGADIYVAKHGNRGVTSKSGSADVLEALGVKIDLSPKYVEKCIEKVGIGFMFAPVFHKAMKYAMPARKQIKEKTVFNILGPLTNPANAKAQVLGIYNEDTEKIAEVLKYLGLERALVVHGLEGMDEISTCKETQISELHKNGKIETYEIKPEDYDIKRSSLYDLVGGDVEQNKKIAIKILRDCEKGSRRDIVLLNASAGIYISGKVKSIKEGVEFAEEVIDSGKAYEKLEKLIEMSNKCIK